MSRTKQGDRVKIHYTEKLEGGQVLDTSKGSPPLEITIGRGIVPLLEEGADGMKVGERKAIRIPPEKAYGTRLNELVLDVKRSSLPRDLEPILGKKVKFRGRDGNRINAIITDIKEDTLTLDANHPLAGKALVFEIELIAIN